MRKEPAGWRILETPMMSKIIADLREQAGCSPVPALMPIGGSKRKYDDWDYVSLESSDFDEASSKASSSLFKMLSSGAPDAPSSGTAGCVPVRQKMDISVAAAVATVTAGKQLTISPAEDKIAVAVPSCGLSYGKPTELCAPVRFVLPLSSSRAPGILKFVGDRPSLGRSESPEPHAMLTVPSTIDSTDSHASSKRPPARSSSSLYRTPSPQNIGRVVVTEPWLQDFDCDTLSSVPRLEELSNAAAARHSSIHEESFLDDDGNDTDTTVEATDIGMGVEDNSDKLDEVAKVTQLTEAESSTNTEVSEPHAEVNAEAIVCVDISGTPTCDKTDAFPATKLPKEVKKKIRREGDREVALDPQPMRRRAAAQSGNYAQRNSFLGSWPSRKQSAAAGTWNL